MCTVKTPKPQASSSEQKKPQYLTNPFLDDPANRALAWGRNSLRIDPGTPLRSPRTPGPTVDPVEDPYGGRYGGRRYSPGAGSGLGINREPGINTRTQLL